MLYSLCFSVSFGPLGIWGFNEVFKNVPSGEYKNPIKGVIIN